MTDVVSWVHISDLHFGHGGARTRFDQAGVVRGIVRDCDIVRRQIGTPDFVFLTGDIAFSGTEYDDVRSWLEDLSKATGVTCDKIFMVPGNHDVDRRATKGLTVGAVHGALRRDPQRLDEYWRDDEERTAIFAAKFAAYTAFSRGHGTDDPKAFCWSRQLETPLGRVRLVGLNTALLSIDKDDGPTNLALSKGQILELVGGLDANELVFVLGHHPPQWLYDGDELCAWLETKPHVLLTGHTHDQKGTLKVGVGRGTLFHLSGGAGHGDQAGQHSYSWGRLNRKGFEFYSRVWRESSKEFIADRNGVAADSEGAVKITAEKLPTELARWLQLTHPAPDSRQRWPNHDVSFIDPQANRILTRLGVAVNDVYAGSSPIRRFDSYEIRHEVQADGTVISHRTIQMTNLGDRPITMLQLEEALEKDEPISFAELEVSIVHCGPIGNEAISIPVFNLASLKSFAILFLPSIQPNESRDLRVRIRLPGVFKRLCSGQPDEVVINIEHEMGITDAAITLRANPDAPAMSVSDFSGTPVRHTQRDEGREHRFHFSAVEGAPWTFRASVRARQ